MDLPIDPGEDAGVAENHDKQREDLQGEEVKEVVSCLWLRQEAPAAHTLTEVHSFSFNGHEDELRTHEGEEVAVQQLRHITNVQEPAAATAKGRAADKDQIRVRRKVDTHTHTSDRLVSAPGSRESALTTLSQADPGS